MQRSLLRNEASQPGAPVPGRRAPPQLAVKIRKDSAWVRWRAAVDPDFFLKGLRTDSLAHKH